MPGKLCTAWLSSMQQAHVEPRLAVQAQDHLFVVGTDGGALHKCSTAYASEYLASYSGHDMAVYSVRWNACHPRSFVSASADWSVKLWDSTLDEVRPCAITHSCLVCDPAIQVHLLHAWLCEAPAAFTLLMLLGPLPLVLQAVLSSELTWPNQLLCADQLSSH